MKIHILSDLHLEFQSFNLPKINADVTVLAGDIHVGEKGISWAKNNITDRPVIYILGNHEYYGHAYPKLLNNLKDKTENTNIYILENDLMQIENVSFLGCTLWTDFALFDNCFSAEYRASEEIMDFRKIRKSPRFSKLKPSDVKVIHNKSIFWIKETIDRIATEKTVVVTHHSPSIKSISEKYKNDILSSSFASNLDDLVYSSQASLWIHGHTHDSFDYQISSTRVICNPRGYPDEKNNFFNPSLVVEI